jgi:N12 class adenine-specific DNA methylase/predicted O-methyltransferase YrrM
MALKRSKPRANDAQLDLFSYTGGNNEHPDSIRNDGRGTLAEVLPENGERSGDERQASGNVVGGGREDGGRTRHVEETVDEGGTNGATSARPSVGNGEGTIHPPVARIGANGPARERVEPPRNQANYRITDSDEVGKGSLKQKCRTNIEAIRLLRLLEKEKRPATTEEKSTLVKYVGWGGIPQVFDPIGGRGWENERDELASLLTEEEHEAAKASTLNAHYTSPEVIRGMYAALERFGFKHGRILEPACGIGHFIGCMPDEMHSRSTITGIEIEPVTARIAKALYPDADIRNQAFESARLADGFYDVAISNIPFGDYQPFDARFNSFHFPIHDYFFAAGLERVRPGGLVLFITSMGTMDKLDSTLREYLSNRVELLGAIRLPNTTFKKNANTEVTTDIVMLRRLSEGETPCGPAWKTTLPYTNSKGETIEINEYFAARPQMMLGEMRLEGRMYSRNEPTLATDKREISKALAEAINQLPKEIYQARKVQVAIPTVEQIIPAPGDVKPNAYTVVDGQVAVRHGETLKLLPNLPSQTRFRIRGLIQVRDAVRKCLRTQMDGSSEEVVETARAQLNQEYDLYTWRFGPISTRANEKAFKGDPDLPLLLSLENYDEEKNKATKTAIFRERTIHRHVPIQSADSPKAALVVSLNEKGRVDMEHMSALLNRPPEEFLPELKGAVFLNPQSNQWETEDHYLSGNVREKLATAEAASLTDSRFKENIEALRTVQPEDLQAPDIDVRLGASWIPAQDVEKFIQELLGADGISVSHAVAIGTWIVNAGYSAKGSVNNTTEWGTNRTTALELIQDALNLKTPTVYDKVRLAGEGEKFVVNAEATEAAREKQERIKDRFKEWIWQDDERRERLVSKYNQEFNCIRLRVFSGEHLTLPGASQIITLRPHQKAGVWRILQTSNTLLGHVVGAGKTYTMVAAGMELKRLGLARKPMFTVPNHMLGQFSSELLNLYPSANILAATKEDFEKDRRRELMSRIATGNWDAIIVTHSGFERIPMSAESKFQFFREQLHELELAILEHKGDHSNRRIVKDLERAKKKLETRLKTLSADEKKDRTLTFEELGVDRLFVDEAHYFKNLFYISKMTRIAGLPQTASERAFDMFLKCQYIQRINGGGGVVFATGTPIANSVAEMYTMQRYLQMGALKKQRLNHFDSWAATFGEPVTAMELAPDGGGYRLNTRFARFINVPELMQQFCQVADIQTADTLKLPIPEIQGGKAAVIRAPATPDLKELVASLVKRAEALRNGRVDPRQDNMLKITSEGRKAALDMRLVKSRARDHPDSKVSLAADKILQIWKDTTEERSAQLVFCDLSTPSHFRGKFSVYDDLKAKLVAQGIPEKEIAFIQDYDSDADKLALFKEVRAGTVRVLMGSTQKMGAGMNVQERLIALHHLDAPWRPADVEQREGRILRQGNNNPVVQIYRYVTEGSFDAYMWQTLETKARFIHQVMTGDTHIRRIEDIDSRALTYAEVKAIASGNPLVIEKASIDAEVTRLTRLRSQHAETQYRIRSSIRRLSDEIPTFAARIENLKHDLAHRKDTRGDAFEIQIAGNVCRDRAKAGEILNRFASQVAGKPCETEIGEFAGFKLIVRGGYFDSADIALKGRHLYPANISENPLGTIRSMEHVVQTLDERIAQTERELKDCEKQKREFESKLGQPFEHESKLQTLVERQQEITKALDLTKNQAANTLDAANPAEGCLPATQSQDIGGQATKRGVAVGV